MTMRYVRRQTNAGEELCVRLDDLEYRKAWCRDSQQKVVTKMDTLEPALDNGSSEMIEKAGF